MPSLTPPDALRWGVWLLAGLLLALGVRAIRPDDVPDNPAYDALVRAHTRRMAADSVLLARTQDSLRAASLNTSRSIARYITVRETLSIHDTTQVRVFVERADSVVRSCTALLSACDRFQVAAESTIAGLRMDRERLRLAVDRSRPSSLDLFVRRTLPVLAFGAGLYAGARVVR